MIGADGVRSRVAGLVGAGVRHSFPADAATFYTYVGGLPGPGFEYHVGQGAFAGVFPTHNGETCVWTCTPSCRTGGIRGGATDAFLELLTEVSPSLAARVRNGRIASRVRGAIGLPNHVRQAAGPGWALVGDAGYQRDPITGHGITDAFRDAELLATHIDDPAEYERRRDAALAEVFDVTRAMTGFPPPEQFVALQRRLSHALDVEAEMLASLQSPVFSGV